MDRSVYDHMAQLDEKHWWYVARARVLDRLIERAGLRPGARLLEIGCGTGPNLAMLQRFGTLDAIEVDDDARAMASRRLGRPVLKSFLPDLAGVERGAYDLVCAFDVIEHVADDRGSVATIAGLLKPGGKFVMAVPAHPWMWSAHDVANHHQRRYSKAALERLIAAAPLKLERIGYLNSLLFPLAIAERFAGKLRGKDEAALGIPPAPVNAFLRAVFAAERHVIGRVPLPPGLSLFAVASAT